jgi:beta-phosphoglucomutase
MIKAVLFDMDGVLVDSEEFICSAAIHMFAEHGLTVQEIDFLPFVGTGENRYLGGVAAKYGFQLDIDRDKARTYQIYKELVKNRLQPLPGVHEFIAACKSKDLKLAVATSADEIKMRTNLEESGIQPNQFDVLIHGMEVANRKPAPDIYLLAADRLGVKSSHCLVVEDAVSGVKAAKAAGALCLALTTSFPEGQLKEADWIVKDLSEASLELMGFKSEK